MEGNLGAGGTLPISPISTEIVRIKKKDKISQDEEKHGQNKKKQKNKEEDAVEISLEGDYDKENMDSVGVDTGDQQEKNDTKPESKQEGRKIDIIV